MDDETRQRSLYRELRSHFDRMDLRLTTLPDEGARITYVPNHITVESNRHPTLLENRIQCLVDIIVQLGIAKTGAEGSN
jgi:acetolactate synthase regulatory subunit